eukprot:1153947-Pelagomonas_calceolata.AAC.2
MVNGEVTVGKAEKLNVTFTQQQLLNAKYTIPDGDFTYEPSYNFVKESPSLAVTKKLSAKDSLKLTYDIRGHGASAEWARKPFKVCGCEWHIVCGWQGGRFRAACVRVWLLSRWHPVLAKAVEDNGILL